MIHPKHSLYKKDKDDKQRKRRHAPKKLAKYYDSYRIKQGIPIRPSIIRFHVRFILRDGNRVGRNGFSKNQTQIQLSLLNPNPNQNLEKPK